MTPTEWIAARRAMLEKWCHATGAQRLSVIRCGIGGMSGISGAGMGGGIVPSDVASLIVAAVNEQEAVVRLVEAVAEMLQSWEDQSPCAEIRLREALAVLVGEQEKSG